MAKYLCGVATASAPVFDASAKTVALGDEWKTHNPQIEMIFNNTTNTLIYSRQKTGLQGTWDSAAAVITLDYDTTADSSDDTDDLHVWVEINDGNRGTDFTSQMYVDGMRAAQGNDVEGKLAAVEAKIENMRTDSNTKLDKLAEIPDSIIVETATGGKGKKIEIIDNSGTKEVHVVDYDANAVAGDAATRVSYSDLIVAVKGLGSNTVDVKVSEQGVVKVPTYPLAQADNIDARGDVLSLDKQTANTAVGGKVQITLVKE